MKNKRNWRAVFTWALFILTLLYALPSAVEMPSWWPFQNKIRGGLDLAGGLELRYTVDWKQSVESTTRKGAESLQVAVVEQLAKDANESYADLPTDKIEGYKARVKVEVQDIDFAVVTMADDGAWAAFDKLENPVEMIDQRFESSESADAKTVTITLSDKEAQLIRSQVLNETRDNLDKRVAGMGLIDPDVRITGDSDIAVQIPGVDQTQMDVVRSVLGRTAQLSMRFVDDNEPWLASADVAAKVEEFKAKNPAVVGLETRRGRQNECPAYGGTVKAKNKSDLARFVRTLTVPADHMIGFEFCEDDTDRDGIVDDKYWQAVYLYSKVELTGQHISRARMGFSQENKPAVYLDMNGEGAQLFADATGKNVGEMLAIMLDEDVQSAPNIKSKISGGKAEISMGGGGQRAQMEARALAEVLTQGAYQAPVYKVHDHAVGPSLGSDSVAAGATAMGVGFALIMAFCVLYYRVSGIIAAGVLVFNLLLMFVLLVAFNAALTLPGVAGIILSMGMAVDGNVLIYERIRDELRLGRTPRQAVDLGFDKAFSAIFDGQLTTAITGFALMQFTSGPMHNFAVSLLIGLATSVFTAVTVSRLIFNYWVGTKKPTTLSI
jgi:preprotein translocase subunit SecD